MKNALFWLGATVAALACTPAPGAGLPMNSPTTVNGAEVVCTGIGDSAQTDPRWSAYPLRVEVVGHGGQWLADADITVARGASQIIATHCDGPWLLAKLPPGRYDVSGTLAGGATASAKAVVRSSGQARAILRFPNAGGAVAPQDSAAH